MLFRSTGPLSSCGFSMFVEPANRHSQPDNGRTTSTVCGSRVRDPTATLSDVVTTHLTGWCDIFGDGCSFFTHLSRIKPHFAGTAPANPPGSHQRAEFLYRAKSTGVAAASANGPRTRSASTSRHPDESVDLGLGTTALCRVCVSDTTSLGHTSPCQPWRRKT